MACICGSSGSLGERRVRSLLRVLEMAVVGMLIVIEGIVKFMAIVPFVG